MKCLRRAHFVAAVLFFMGIFLASSSCFASASEEITHLLSFIETSDCTFIRNGKKYDGQQAGKHIQQKYEYLRSRIKTTEDFISYSATVSSMTGKPYRVLCNNQEMLTADWLAAELDRMRTGRNSNEPEF